MDSLTSDPTVDSLLVGRDGVRDTLAPAPIALLLTASLIAVDPDGWFPFSIVKWAAVVLLALGVIVATMWSETGPRPVPSGAFAMWTVLLCLTAGSAIVGVDVSTAWIGTPVRHLGAMTWFFFAAMWLVGARITHGRPVVLVGLARGAAIGTAILGAYVVVETIGSPPIDYVNAASSSRLGGPFGSSAYLGASMALLTPIAVGVAIDRVTTRGLRLVAWCAAAASLLGLVGSGARAALVGVIGGALIALASLAVRSAGRVRPVVIRASAAGFVCVAVAAGVALVGGVYERSAGWSSRLDEWRIGGRAITDRPLLGAGPEGYRVVAPGFIDDAYVRAYGERAAIDRAHSGVLDVAISSGVVAALLYLALFGALIVAAARVIRSNGSPSSVGLAVGVVSYAIAQQLLFPIAEIDLVFWLLAGAVMSCGLNGATTTLPRWSTRAIGGVAASLLVVVAVTGVRWIAADRAAHDAVGASSSIDAVANAERAADLAPWDDRFVLLAATALASDGSLAATQAALARADAIGVAPRDPPVVLTQARLASTLAAITGDPGDVALARQRWDDLVVSWPSCAQCAREAGRAALLADDRPTALALLERAVDLGDDLALASLDALQR